MSIFDEDDPPVTTAFDAATRLTAALQQPDRPQNMGDMWRALFRVRGGQSSYGEELNKLNAQRLQKDKLLYDVLSGERTAKLYERKFDLQEKKLEAENARLLWDKLESRNKAATQLIKDFVVNDEDQLKAIGLLHQDEEMIATGDTAAMVRKLNEYADKGLIRRKKAVDPKDETWSLDEDTTYTVGGQTYSGVRSSNRGRIEVMTPEGWKGVPPGGKFGKATADASEQKILEIMRANPGVSYQDAANVALGVTTVTVDGLGRKYMVNKATNEARPIGTAGGTPAAPADFPAIESRGAGPADVQPGAPSQAMGGTGVLYNVGNYIADFLGGGPGAPDVEVAKNAINHLNTQMILLMSRQVGERPNVFTQEMLRKNYTVTPESFTETDESARLQMEQARNAIADKMNNMAQMIADEGSYKPADVADAKAHYKELKVLKEQYDKVLDAWKGGGLPKGVPEGSKYIGKTLNNKPVYETPDGKKLVVD